MPKRNKTIAEIMISLSDEELIEMLPYIRDEDGEQVSLIGLRHLLRETVKEGRSRNECNDLQMDCCI